MYILYGGALPTDSKKTQTAYKIFKGVKTAGTPLLRTQMYNKVWMAASTPIQMNHINRAIAPEFVLI